MRILFLETAQFELYEAVDYYNGRSPELGDRFLNEVLLTVDRIAKILKHGLPPQNAPEDAKPGIFPLE